MAMWFECRARYDKIQENGTVKKVNEPYLVDALSFSEAEARLVENLTPYMSGEFFVSAIKRTKIAEIFFDGAADKYWLVKVNFITIDEKTGVEKKVPTYILVQANDDASAKERFNEGMKGTMADFAIESISETKIMDVFPIKLG